MSPGPWEPQPRMRKTLFDVLPEGGASTRARAIRGRRRENGARTRTDERNRRATQWTRIIYRPSGAGTRRRRAWDTVAEA